MAREERSGEVGLRRKAATLASIIALVALIVGALFGDRGNEFFHLAQISGDVSILDGQPHAIHPRTQQFFL